MIRKVVLFLVQGSIAMSQDMLDPLVVSADGSGRGDVVPGIIPLRIGGGEISEEGFSDRDALLSAIGGYAGNPTLGSFSLRGLNNDAVLGTGGVRSNGIIVPLVGGVPLSTNTARYFPRLVWDLESLTVYKSGQATMDGPAAFGGVVSYEDTRPGFDWTGKTRMEVGERGFFHTGLSQNFVVIEDTLAMRLHYERLESDGSVENVFLDNEKFGKTERDFFKGQLLWVPGNGESTVLAAVEYGRSDSNPFAASKVFGGFSRNDRKAEADTRTFFPAERWLGSVALDHVTAEGLEIRSVLGFTALEVDGVADLDGGNARTSLRNELVEEKHFTYGLSLEGGQEENVGWRFGTYHQFSGYDYTQDIRLDRGAVTVPILSVAEEDVDIHALYGEVDFRMDEKWNLIAGARLNHESRETDVFSRRGASPEVRNSLDQSSTDILPSVALEWDGGGDWSAGLRLARNYRSGGVSYAPSLGLVRDFDPEYSNDIELSVAYRDGGSWDVHASVFYSDMEDTAVPFRAPGALSDLDTLIANAGSAHRYGLEIGTRWTPAHDWKVDAIVAYTVTEFDELVINGVDRSGENFPNAPELVASLRIGYQPVEGVFGNVRFSWASESYSQIIDPAFTELEARMDVSGRVGYRKGNWEVYAFVKNLLDDDYALGAIDGRSLGNGVISKLNEPRTIGVGWALEW